MTLKRIESEAELKKATGSSDVQLQTRQAPETLKGLERLLLAAPGKARSEAKALAYSSGATRGWKFRGTGNFLKWAGFARAHSRLSGTQSKFSVPRE